MPSMATKTLSKREKSKIELILEEAEKDLLGITEDKFSLEELDQQCKDIWSDWDTSVMASRSISTSSSTIKPSSQDENTEIKNEDSSVLSELMISTSQTKQPNDDHHSYSQNDSFTSSGSERKPITKSSKKSNTSHHRTNNTRPKTTRHQSYENTQSMTRTDAARLRQENIELKSQLTKLQTAFDKINIELSRTKEELAKTKVLCSKQKKTIAFLKEEKFYGK